MKCFLVVLISVFVMASSAAGNGRVLGVLQKGVVGVASNISKVSGSMSKTAAAAVVTLGLASYAPPAVADDYASHQSAEQLLSSENATRNYLTSNVEWSDRQHRWWQFQSFSLDSEHNKNLNSEHNKNLGEFVRSFSNVYHYGALMRSWQADYARRDNTISDTIIVADQAVANFYAQQSSLTAYDYETVLISWLAEGGYHVGIVRRALSARKMLVEAAFSVHRAHIVDIAEVSGVMLANWGSNYEGTRGNKHLSLPSEGVLAYHRNAVSRSSLQQLPSQHKVWLPLIIQNMQGDDSVLPPAAYDPSRQLPPVSVGEEFYRGYLIAVLSDGLRVVKVNVIGNSELTQNLQHQFYVLVRGEHLGYGYEEDTPHAHNWLMRGSHYDKHGQNLEVGGINWHGHEAAAYLNNYGKQRFFGSKDSEAENYYSNRDNLGTMQYDGVFVLYEKNARLQVGLASLSAPDLLSVQHIDGTSDTTGATAIKGVLVVHHPDYAGGGRQVSISPTDMRPLNAEELDSIFAEDDVLLARIVLVLTGGLRVVEVRSVPKKGTVKTLLGLVHEDSWLGD